MPPALGVWRLNHWTTKELLGNILLSDFCLCQSCWYKMAALSAFYVLLYLWLNVSCYIFAQYYSLLCWILVCFWCISIHSVASCVWAMLGWKGSKGRCRLQAAAFSTKVLRNLEVGAMDPIMQPTEVATDWWHIWRWLRSGYFLWGGNKKSCFISLGVFLSLLNKALVNGPQAS